MNPAPDSHFPLRHAAELPSLDAERMEMLRELCLDAGQDMLRDMLGSWEREAARHLANAQKAMVDADAEGLKHAAHALKGSCGNMGIVRLAELGRQLEMQVAAPAEATVLLTEMQQEFALAREQLAKITV
jgi:HPt (histidine-containing phosphotransfer) domain-containing protein